MTQKGNSNPLLPLYMKLYHRSNGNYPCACEVYAIPCRQYRNHGEGSCETGDFVLLSDSFSCLWLDKVSGICVVNNRVLAGLLSAQSYRICRQIRPFLTAAQGSPFLTINNIFYSTSLEMSQGMYGNCSQAGAEGSVSSFW